MAKLVAFYSRTDENYFGGAMKYIKVGNTEKHARMIAFGEGYDRMTAGLLPKNAAQNCWEKSPFS